MFFVSYCVSALPAARLVRYMLVRGVGRCSLGWLQVDEYGLRPCVIFSAWLQVRTRGMTLPNEHSYQHPSIAQALGCGLRVLTIQEHESAVREVFDACVRGRERAPCALRTSGWQCLAKSWRPWLSACSSTRRRCCRVCGSGRTNTSPLQPSPWSQTFSVTCRVYGEVHVRLPLHTR